MNRSTVYLVANNMSPSEEVVSYVSNIKLNDDDLVVVFNQANSPLVKLFPRIDIACFRFNGACTKSHYFGVDNNLKIKPHISKANLFLFMHGTNLNMLPPVIEKNNIEDRYEAHREGKSQKYEDIEYVYGPGRAPTTGMFYVFHFLNKYPDHNIELIGFDAFGGNKRDNLHPFSRERVIIDKLAELDRLKVIV